MSYSPLIVIAILFFLHNFIAKVHLVKEPILEPLLRRLRIRRILPIIARYPACRLLDIGCGWEARFLREVEPHISKGVGIDFKAPEIKTGKIETYRAVLADRLPFPDHSFEVVTMLAVLEHLDNPVDVVKEALRVLVPGGIFAGTVPSKAAKPVLEFLSYRLGIVNPDEIRDHKCYYDRELLVATLAEAGFDDVHHRYFQFGMNNFFVASQT